jgi:ATP-dependent Clp protease ATP-binding subunit ClpC
VFQRFTEPARHVVVLAQEEARALGHEQLGTEHLLLGLLRARDGLASRVLRSLGLTIDDVQAQVIRIRGRGPGETGAIGGQLSFTQRAQRTLELALREALSLGHGFIGTEHILLGIARNGENTATRVLRELGAEPRAVRAEVLRLLSGGASPAGQAPITAVVGGEPATPRARERSWPVGAVVAGWLGFGVAVGIGLLLGRLIWG